MKFELTCNIKIKFETAATIDFTKQMTMKR